MLVLQVLRRKNEQWKNRQEHQSASLQLVAAPLTFGAVCQECPSTHRARAVVRCCGAPSGVVSTGCGQLCIECDNRCHEKGHFCMRKCILNGTDYTLRLGEFLLPVPSAGHVDAVGTRVTVGCAAPSGEEGALSAAG